MTDLTTREGRRVRMAAIKARQDANHWREIFQQQAINAISAEYHTYSPEDQRKARQTIRSLDLG